MTVIAVLADCHIHPAAGLDWPPGALAALQGVDRIVTLGDMGERAGLAPLAAIAPIEGVMGEDDEPPVEGDPGWPPVLTWVIEEDGLRIGCVFDPVAAGLASSKAPFVASETFAEAQVDLFDDLVDVVLCASTHSPGVWRVGETLVVDPGSVTVPEGKDKGAKGTFARLTIADGKASAL